MPPWNEIVLYEIHVGTFNAKPEKPSTFSDCLNKIQYLKKLGISAISVMPVCSFPGDYSWGYNPTDFFPWKMYTGKLKNLKNLLMDATKKVSLF
jgi:1,4-alpha-glucan branching enzyme